MANKVYPKAQKAFLDADIDLLVDDVRALLIDAGSYTYSDSHEFLSDVAGGARIGTATALASKTTTGGVFDAADVVITAVSGSEAEAVILYKHTGVEGTSRLISYMDLAIGLPVTPNGNDITLQWDNGTNKIFALG